MEEFVKSFMDLGIVGVIAFISLKSVLDDKKRTETLLQNEIDNSKKEIQRYRDEISKITGTYREELRKDREVYIDTINLMSGEIKGIKSDITCIKGKVSELASKTDK